MSARKGQVLKRKKQPIFIAEDDKEFSAAFREKLYSSFEEFAKHIQIRAEDADGNPISIPFHPDTWFDEQRDFILNRTGRDLVLKARQIGMTTVNLILDLFFVLSKPGGQCLVVLAAEPQAKGAWITLSSALDSLIQLQERLRKAGYVSLDIVPPIERSNQSEIAFVGGSAIFIVAAKAEEQAADRAIRSFRFQRAHLSELAYWKFPQETLAGILNGMPAEGGEIVIESTPKSLADVFGQYYQKAKKGENGFKVHFWPWYFHQRNRKSWDLKNPPLPANKIEEALLDPFGTHKIDVEQLAFWQMKTAQIGLEKTLIDYPIDEASCWLAKGSRFLNPQRLNEKAAKEKREPDRIQEILGLPLRIFREPIPLTQYIIGADVAWGTGADSCSAVVLNAETNEVVATARSNTIRPEDFGRALIQIAGMYNEALVAPERNGVGLSVLRALADGNYWNVYRHVKEDGSRTDDFGWDTNVASRPVMLATLEALIADDLVRIPCEELFGQLASLVRVKGKDKVRAEGKGKEGGKSDDMALALMIALEVRIRAAHLWARDSSALTLNRELSKLQAGRNVHRGIAF